ncbi:10412_t:CDS:2, partial [Ambispora gerdemannii]
VKSFKEYIEALENPNYEEGAYDCPPNPTSLERMKYDTCQSILDYKLTNRLTTQQIAQQIQLSPAETEELLFCRIEKFTLDRLVDYATKETEYLRDYLTITENKEQKEQLGEPIIIFQSEQIKDPYKKCYENKVDEIANEVKYQMSCYHCNPYSKEIEKQNKNMLEILKGNLEGGEHYPKREEDKKKIAILEKRLGKSDDGKKDKGDLDELKKLAKEPNKNSPEYKENEQFIKELEKELNRITSKDDKLLIEYNNAQKETKAINTTELQQTKSYLEKIGKKELSLSDLEQSGNNQPTSPEKSNKGLYIGLAVAGVLVLGVIIYFLFRNKKERNS